MSSERAAIALRLTAVACATGLGACVHGAAAHASVGQIVLLRSCLSIPFLLAWAAVAAPPADWLPRAPRKHLIRGLFGGASMVLSFYALSQLPVAHASALGYLAPILMLPAAVIMLGERLSTRSVLAVALGFAGMIAMLYTSVANPDWGTAELTGVAAGIASAGTMALVRVHIRAMTVTETVMSIALTFAVITTGIGVVATALTGWTPMTGPLWIWTGMAGLLGAATHITATEAAARAAVSTLAPFDYTGLIFAVALDWALFSNLPGGWGWVGMLLITGAALLTVFRRPRPTGLTLR